jgi:hypothetical protein
MDFIHYLWLPIVLATVICFAASAVMWMFAPHHKSEWKEAPNVDGLRDLLRKAGAQPGGYTFPHMSAEDRADKAKAAAKMKQYAEGPSGVLYVVAPGPMSMGPMLAKQFAFFLICSVFLAYVASHTLAHGTPYLAVFRVVGATGFMTYALGTAPESIWFARPWKSFWLTAVDGLIYACLTAGTFGAFWPKG